MRIPKTLGACVDLGYELEQKRLAYQHEAEKIIAEMKASEKELDDALLIMLQKQKLDKAAGSSASVSISKQPLPKVTDWEAFWAHIKKTGEFDLLERRPARAAYKERIEAKKAVPGVETFWDTKLYYGKINKDK